MKEILIMEQSYIKDKTRFQKPSDIFKAIKKIDIDMSKEHFIVITLDTQLHIINVHIITIGLLDASLAHPREVFKPAILDNAKSIILCHNHPSGNLKPSRNDTEVTKALFEAGVILDIRILDHIIFNETEFLSLKQWANNGEC